LGEPKSHNAWNKVAKKHEKNGVKIYHDYDAIVNETDLLLSFEEYENPFWDYSYKTLKWE
jgi:hypothetical protein